MQNLTASHVSDRDEYLHFISLESSLGFPLTAVSPRGICAILMGDTREELERELRRESAAQSTAYSDFGLEGIGAQTVKTIETPQLGVSLPLDLQGTPLQISVWQALQAIPIGETATYEEIARRHPGVIRTAHHERNRGKGAAVRVEQVLRLAQKFVRLGKERGCLRLHRSMPSARISCISGVRSV